MKTVNEHYWNAGAKSTIKMLGRRGCDKRVHHKQGHEGTLGSDGITGKGGKKII